MAYTDVLDLDLFSVGFADQTAMDSEGSSWTWLDCTMPKRSPQPATTQERRSSGARGASSKLSVGHRWWNYTFRCEMPGQLTTFDPSSGNPVANGAWELVADALGATHVGAYGAAVVDGTPDANTVSRSAGSWKVGCAYAFGSSDTAITCIGIVKSVSGSVATLAFDMRAVPSVGDNIYPLLTIVPGTTVPTPKTFRVVGESSNHDRRHIGAVPSQLVFQWDAADKLWCDFTYICYGGQNNVGGGGGLQDVPDLYLLEASIGRGGARDVIGYNVLTDLNDGTADADGVCDLTGKKITIDLPHHPVMCPASAEGVSACKVLNPNITVDYNAPAVPDLVDTDEYIFVDGFVDQTAVPFWHEMGDRSGRLFAAHIPAAIPSGEPGDAEVNGAAGFAVTSRATRYSGDGASTDAGNTSARFCIG